MSGNPEDDLFRSRKTSAQFLAEFAARKFNKPEDPSGVLRYVMIYDLYIKANSYIWINKTAFGFGFGFLVLVIAWPAIAAMQQDGHLLQSAVIQTSITGLAAVTGAIYSHYKKRQMAVENLLRFAVFSDKSNEDVHAIVLEEMERIDTGFSFHQSSFKAPSDSDG